MNTQEKIIEAEQQSKIKLHAVTIAQTVGFALSIVVLILEILFSKESLHLGFCCLGTCFAMSTVEKWLAFFSMKMKNDLWIALAESAAFGACAAFVLLAVL